MSTDTSGLHQIYIMELSKFSLKVLPRGADTYEVHAKSK